MPISKQKDIDMKANCEFCDSLLKVLMHFANEVIISHEDSPIDILNEGFEDNGVPLKASWSERQYRPIAITPTDGD